MNESCHTYKWVMSHIWMSMSHTNESFHIWRMEVTLFTLVNPERSLRFNTHWSSPPVSALTQPGGVTSCHTYEWVMSHIWMSHVTHMNESCHIWMSHVTHMNESRHAYEWAMSHMNQSCHTYEWVMSHIWMSHVTYEWVISHTWMSHISALKKNSCHTDAWVMSCMNETRYKWEWVMSRINESNPTYVLMWLINNSHFGESYQCLSTILYGHWSDLFVTHILIDIEVTQ